MKCSLFILYFFFPSFLSQTRTTKNSHQSHSSDNLQRKFAVLLCELNYRTKTSTSMANNEPEWKWKASANTEEGKKESANSTIYLIVFQYTFLFFSRS